MSSNDDYEYIVMTHHKRAKHVHHQSVGYITQFTRTHPNSHPPPPTAAAPSATSSPPPTPSAPARTTSRPADPATPSPASPDEGTARGCSPPAVAPRARRRTAPPSTPKPCFPVGVQSRRDPPPVSWAPTRRCPWRERESLSCAVNRRAARSGARAPSPSSAGRSGTPARSGRCTPSSCAQLCLRSFHRSRPRPRRRRSSKSSRVWTIRPRIRRTGNPPPRRRRTSRS
mmetsp:Transcript_7695/g.34868  ORF Transcript_7695/g.34868 Transcript_7695/m.34868 type:complete len:228 (-) Transcript_7695:718-1401(-)